MFTNVTSSFKIAPQIQPNGTYVFEGVDGHVVITRHDLSDDIIECWVNHNNKLYRWINIEYASEEEERKMFSNFDEQSYNVSTYDELAFSDIVEKATAVVNCLDFNDDVVITIELNDDIKNWVEKHCEDNQITISEFMEMAIDRAFLALKNERL